MSGRLGLSLHRLVSVQSLSKTGLRRQDAELAGPEVLVFPETGSESASSRGQLSLDQRSCIH